MSRNDSMSLRLDTAKWFTVDCTTMFLLVLPLLLVPSSTLIRAIKKS